MEKNRQTKQTNYTKKKNSVSKIGVTIICLENIDYNVFVKSKIVTKRKMLRKK